MTDYLRPRFSSVFLFRLFSKSPQGFYLLRTHISTSTVVPRVEVGGPVDSDSGSVTETGGRGLTEDQGEEGGRVRPTSVE